MREAIDNFRQAIKAVLGNAPEEIEPGKMQRFSTAARASDAAGWCRMFTDGGAGVFGDFRTGVSSLWSAEFTKPPTLSQRQQYVAELQLARSEAAAAQAVKWALAADSNATLWAQASPIAANDPVVSYLDRRGIQLRDWPQALRHHPDLSYWHEGQCIGRFPAMLGAVTDAAGELVCLHRTYLTADGRKAEVPTVKKLTACAARLAGASVKLCQPAPTVGGMTIGVAEGIETALACFAASGIPTMSAISAHGMEQYQWPLDVKSLIVFADNDVSQVGQRAAAALRRRANAGGLDVRVLTPPQAGADWADVWVSRAEVI